MGAPKQKWKSEEEEALRRGVLKHGPGKWRTIQKDPEFSPILSARSNIDLKDKWRNLAFSGYVSSSSPSTLRETTPKMKSKSSPRSSTPEPQDVILSAAENVDVSPTAAPTPSGVTSRDSDKSNPGYGAMVMEALHAIKEPLGAELGAIFKFIEQKHEIPTNFRRFLGTKLRRLLQQNKIEKIHKGYRFKDPNSATKTPVVKPKDGPSTGPKDPEKRPKDTSGRPKDPSNRPKDTSGRPKPWQSVFQEDRLQLAACAAYKLADAEAKAYFASEAIKEAERIGKMSEENDALLMLAKEMVEKCSKAPTVTICQAAC